MIASLLLTACLAAATPAAPAPAPAAKPTAKPPATTPAAAAPGKAAPATTAPAPAATPEAPKGLVRVETKRGTLEFSHKVHAQTACADCHRGQAVPARIGVKGVEAAHKFCVDCHKAGKKGPEKCSWCHQRP